MKKALFAYLLQNQILTAILIVAFAWLIIETREVLITIFVAYILMTAVSPYVNYLRKHGFPKPLAVAIPYLATIAFFLLIIMLLLPFFISQVRTLLTWLPAYLNQEINFFGARIDSSEFSNLAANELGNLGGNALVLTSRVFGGVISAVSIFAISFYLLLYRETVDKNFVLLFPKRHQARVEKTILLIEDKLGSWLRGQIVLSGFIGLISWTVLTLLGVSFALPLAVIAGILEIVPTIGPIIAAIPAIIVALNVSPLLAAIVAVSYFLIQLFENNVLVPRVMQRAVGLNPIVIILGIIIGGKLLGLAGALLAIPFISLLVVVYKNLE